MTNKKQSALEQLREAMEGVLNTNEPKLLFHFAILELAERVQASEAKLEALEERARQEDQFLEDGTVPEHLKK